MAMSDTMGATDIRILLVGAEEEYLGVLRRRLAKRGLRVTTATSGSEAIQVLRRQDFDVIVLDLEIEDMESSEVLKILKQMDPCVPIILLVGEGSEKSARDGLAHGASDYLTKPCGLEELLVKIENTGRGGGGQVD